MNKTKKFILFLILASQIITWIVLYNLNLNLAFKLNRLENQNAVLSEEIQKKTIELAKLTSLTYLKQEADKLGLVPIEKINQANYSPLASIKENGQ
jgi:hypothetical protein